MKFSEVVTKSEEEGDRLEWLIRKDGCMHCEDPGCLKACPSPGAIVQYTNGIVDFNEEACIGCGYCYYACPFGAPQFAGTGLFNHRGKMDKCTFCAGGPEQDHSEAEFRKYGRNRLAEGKLPACAEMCSTKALLAGDGDVVADIFRTRVVQRGKGAEVWGWGTAYGKPTTPTSAPAVAPAQGKKS